VWSPARCLPQPADPSAAPRDDKLGSSVPVPRQGSAGTGAVSAAERSSLTPPTGIPSMAEQLDAITVGTGQGRKPLAGALAEAGWRTAIIERGRVGGTCVIDGCTPSKTLIASARVAHLARRSSDYGVETGAVEVDLAAVRRRKREIVDSFSASGERGLRRHDTLELILGEARFVGSHEIEVRLNDGGSRRLTAQKIFINAGARPSVPPIAG